MFFHFFRQSDSGRRAGAISLCFAWLAMSLSIEGAEVVYLRSNSNKLSGAVEDLSVKGLRLKTPKGEVVSIPADDIKQILWEGEPIILRNSRNSDLAERTATALEGYRTALKEIPEEQKRFREEAEFGVARCLARQAATDPQQTPEALAELARFAKQYPESLHYYDSLLLAADLALKSNQVDAAQENYRILKGSATGTYPLLGELGLARLALAKGDSASAAKSLQAVLDSPLKGALVTRRQMQARMELAGIQLVENRTEEAAKISGEVIASSPPDDAESLARAYLLRGNCYLKLGNQKEALFDFLHVDLLFSQESAAHAEALYHLAELWPALKHPERGVEARDRLASLYPDSEWTKKR